MLESGASLSRAGEDSSLCEHFVIATPFPAPSYLSSEQDYAVLARHARISGENRAMIFS
jgi:hypothetical protein